MKKKCANQQPTKADDKPDIKRMEMSNIRVLARNFTGAKISLIFLIAILCIFCTHISFDTQRAFADSGFQVYGTTQVRKLPRGTRMELQAVEPVSTENARIGNPFSAVLVNNLKLEKQMVLPAGTMVRGNVQDVTDAKRLSRSALLGLNFDHVVTPAGRQLPIKAAPCSNLKMTKEGLITTGTNYGQAMGKTWNRSVDIVKNSTQWGIDAGSELFKGGEFLLTPVAALGGTFGGAGYLAVGTVINVFKKGDDVIINQGDRFDILLLESLDVPVY